MPPDARFNSVELARFINKVMKCGKKTVAQRIVYGALDVVQEDARREPLELFGQALKNATPLLEVKPRRVGGATYQVPTDLRPNRGEALAIRWIIRSARARKGMPIGAQAGFRADGCRQRRRRCRKATRRGCTAWLRLTGHLCITGGRM